MSALPSRRADLLASLRRMRVGDLDRVAEVERQAYPFPWTRGNFADSLASGYDGWCVERDGVVLAYAIVMWLPGEVHLLNITVAPPHQGHGVGRRLLEHLLSDAHGRGAESMMLEVRPSNDRARALYASMGFEEIGVRRRYYPSWDNAREDALVLRRRCAHE